MNTHKVWKFRKFSLTQNSWNQIFSNLCIYIFSKTVAFTKFSSKKCEREFTKFPHCVLWRIHYKVFTHQEFIVVTLYFCHHFFLLRICSSLCGSSSFVFVFNFQTRYRKSSSNLKTKMNIVFHLQTTNFWLEFFSYTSFNS